MKQTNVIPVQSTEEQAVSYAKLCGPLSLHTLCNTACITALWLKYKPSVRARSDSVQVLVQARSVGRRSVLMLGTSTLTLAHYLILNLQACNQVSRLCKRVLSSQINLCSQAKKAVQPKAAM